MAKQAGILKITGTYGDITFYKMEGTYYARMKSSLTAERVKKDPAFARTMANAAIFAEANKIASLVYRQLDAAAKGRAVRYELLRQARKMLAAGASKATVIERLKSRQYRP